METLLSLAEALERSSFGAWARGAWPYPIANLGHLLGLVLLVGGIGFLDLRLAGLFRSLPLAPLSRILTPAAVGGLVIMAITGPVMFAADAGHLAKSPLLQLKLILIAVALGNAVLFRVMWRGRLRDWDARTPTAGRLMALASVGLWLWIAALGRLIAYA